MMAAATTAPAPRLPSISRHVSIVFTAALITHWVEASTGVRAVMWVHLDLTGLATVYFGRHTLMAIPAGLTVGATPVFLAARATRTTTLATTAPGNPQARPRTCPGRHQDNRHRPGLRQHLVLLHQR